MKPKIITNRLSIKIAALIIVVNSIAISCSAYPPSSNVDNNMIQRDSVMRNAIGDSIYSIIINAKKVKAEVIKLNDDSISQYDKIVVKKKNLPLIQFILSDSQIYKGYTAVYGVFVPNFTLTFIKKKESCMTKFDFGLKKWSVCDDKGNVIKTFDLSSNDMLRFANILFPHNNFIHSHINIEKK